MDLTASTAYTFSVKAVDAASNSSTSNERIITTAPPSTDTQAPTASVLSLDSQTTSTASLSWTPATDNEQLAFYYLYQNNTQIATLPASSASYTVSDLAPGSYSFALRAVDAAGNQSQQSNPVTATITAPEPTEPTDSTDTQAPSPFELTASASPTSLTLSWNTPQDNQGITSYIILKNGVATDTLTGTATSFVFQNLDASTAYTFTVVAYDEAGNSSEATYSVTLDEVAQPTTDPAEPEPTEPELPLTQTPTGPAPLFTPNDDGINDTWLINLAPGEQLTALKVYDQRGQLVFSATDNNQPWNGTFQGKPLPAGAYYYSFTLIDTNNNVPQTATGTVAIIR